MKGSFLDRITREQLSQNVLETVASIHVLPVKILPHHPVNLVNPLQNSKLSCARRNPDSMPPLR